MTVVEFLPRILIADDPDMTDAVRAVLEAEGITFHLDSAVERVRNLGTEREVAFKTGQESKPIRAEMVLVATGRKVNLEGLGLNEIGVAFDRNGLKRNDRLRTTRPYIFGAGDDTGVHPFTHAAGYEGGVVLSNALFRLPRKVNYTYLPWVTYTDPELASMTFSKANPKVSTRLGAYGSPLEETIFQEQLWVQVDYQVNAEDPWNPIGTRKLLAMVPYAMSSIMAESGGSVRSVTAGPGLSGSGVTGDVTLRLSKGGVRAANLAEAAVTSAKIAAATITSHNIAGGAVTDDKITGPIASSKLGAHGHSGSDVTSGTIPTARLNVGLAAGTVAAGDHTHNHKSAAL